MIKRDISTGDYTPQPSFAHVQWCAGSGHKPWTMPENPWDPWEVTNV